MRALAQEFPVIAKKDMVQRFRRLRIGQSGDLLDTMDFRGKVLINGVMVEIDYLYYGMFPDLGVGNGIKMDDVSVSRLLGLNRRKKNWTRMLAATRHRLGELYSKFALEEISQHANQTYERTLRFRL